MKKIAVFIVIFSLLGLSMLLKAKTRKGAALMICCLNDQIYEGELILV